MISLKTATLLVGALALAGCANTFGGVDVHRISSSLSVVSQPANVRSMYTDGVFYCPEPPPDAALQAVANAAVKATQKSSASADVSGGLTTSVVQLAGRTQTVLIARDALSANCILSMNGFIDKKQAETNFTAVLEVIRAIAKADQTAAEADATRAQTEKTIALAGLDPAIVKDANATVAAKGAKADAIIAALSDNKGGLDTAKTAKFFTDADKQKILTQKEQKFLGSQTDPKRLRSYLMGSFFDSLDDLAATLAK